MHLRTHLAALALGALVAGCGDSPTSPVHTVTAPAPSGLRVSFALSPYAGPTAGGPSVAAAGDSVVVAGTLLGGGCGMDVSASAGVADGALVVTAVSRFPDAPVACALVAYAGGPTFRAVVRPAPRGRYAVVLRERTQTQVGAPTFDEREITRRGVVLP